MHNIPNCQTFKRHFAFFSSKTCRHTFFFVTLPAQPIIRMISLIKRVLAVFLLVAFTPIHTSAQASAQRTYTEEHPLIYEDAWDLWPYVFLNEHGEPEGFNVDVLRELFKELNIPFVIKLKPTKEALEDLKKGQSDLMLRLVATFHDDYARYGKETVQMFTHSVVSPKSSIQVVRTVDDLASQKVIVHAGSLSHRMMTDLGWKANVLPYGDMKEAIQKVSTENQGLIVWNTMSLKWLMRKFQTQNLQLTPIDLPHGEYKFMSNDTILLNRLDSAYSRLRSTDRILAIQNKWFYPEQIDTGIPQWVTYVAIFIALLAFLLLYYVFVLHIRQRKMTQLIARHNRRLALVFNTTKVHVWLYDVKRKKITWVKSDGELEEKEHILPEYEHEFTPTSFDDLKKSIKQIIDGTKSEVSIRMTGIGPIAGNEYILALSVFRRSRNGEPTMLVAMTDNQTERLQKQRKAKDAMLRYQSIFSSSMVDMTYYNTEGILTDINQKACETFKSKREDILAEGVSFRNALEDPTVKMESFEGAYTTHIIHPQGNMNLAQSINLSHNIYYEQQLMPMHDATGRFLGIFGSGRDVSEFVNSYHQLRRSISQLQKAATDVTEYINNINFALHVGGVRLANYSPNSHTLTIFREMNVVQLTLTQSRCLSYIDDLSKRRAVRLFNNMDMRSGDAVDVGIKTNIRTEGGHKLSLQFHFIPVYDEKGNIDNYFGLCHDISHEKATEEELEHEKSKAQEVENVKNAFLRNMSHEIRTPISTVVGFAELFVEEHDPADEDGFIEEIKKNANFLLNLVNDILFLSRLDAHMIEFNPSPIDFAYTFEGHCQMGWAKVMKPDVNYVVENPYEHLIVNIDDANVGRIIEQIANNAANYTAKGRVSARYDYIIDKLIITIDDTGPGISAERQRSIFERFSDSSDSNSTKLGLPICKELAEQMGGAVYMNSALGSGTTMWIIIPCQATVIEKRKQLSN